MRCIVNMPAYNNYGQLSPISVGEYNRMLREETVSYAANVHCRGARFLRDSIASLLPCCTLFDTPRVLALQRVLTQAENILKSAIGFSAGLLTGNGLSKYTAVIEARMQLLGVPLDGTLLSLQQAAAREKNVPPGTRSDIYDGFLQLGKDAETVCGIFCDIADAYVSSVRDGRVLCAVPYNAIRFLVRLSQDYAAACRHIEAGEAAQLMCRTDAFADMLSCLQAVALSQGAQAGDATIDALAAMASSGLIVSLPPMLFDILLRYENLDKV